MTTERTGQTTDLSNQRLSAINSQDNFSVADRDTEKPNKESFYIADWGHWHGLYRAIPELRHVIDKLASWTFGKKIESDEKNKAKLRKIRGFGKGTPRSVLKNVWRVALICGDGYAEIIKDNQGRMTNLKPLNPGTITIIYDDKGIIERYEQIIDNKIINKWDIDEIFHISNEPIADEGHGIPFPEALENLINSRNEGLEDLRVLYHRNIKPIHWIEVETDDKTKLNSIENSINQAYKKTENIVIPTGVIREIKRQNTPQYSTLDSLPYIKFLVRQFVTGCGMPEVVMGWGAETTEASSKIIYVAFQQVIEDMQIYIMEQMELQLNIEIKLKFPASILEDLQKDEKKDGPENIDRNETTANIKGKK